ncbi:MAG: hypothetical protein QG562_20 [Patescibacteria group bacterium]|nr:hypothetical protein [Patescibacteria group bacterium]
MGERIESGSGAEDPNLVRGTEISFGDSGVRDVVADGFGLVRRMMEETDKKGDQQETATDPAN